MAFNGPFPPKFALTSGLSSFPSPSSVGVGFCREREGVIIPEGVQLFALPGRPREASAGLLPLLDPSTCRLHCWKIQAPGPRRDLPGHHPWSGLGPGCPGPWGSPHPWRGSNTVWMWHLGTRFHRHGGAGVIVGSDDLRGLSQP